MMRRRAAKPVAVRGNLASALPRRGRAPSMARYDRLPAPLRGWLAGAALPWSPQSVLRIWTRLHRETGGDTHAVLRRLDLAEQRMLARDVAAVWGAGYPLCAPVSGPEARS